MSCSYIKGKEKLNTNKILNLFYKENYIISNSAIFSSDELQKNTFERLISLESNANYITSENVPVGQFITKENPAFANIVGLENQTRLSPEYILEKRASQYVKDHINDSDLFNLVESNPDVDKLYMSIESELSDTIKEDISKVKYLLNILSEELKLEDINKEFGIELHNLISDKLRDRENSYQSKLDTLVKNELFKPIFGIASIEDWKSKINNIVSSIQKEVNLRGETISELHFVYNNSDKDKFAVKGKIDLIAVDTAGVAHIFEIKVSKNSYEKNKWENEKLLTLD